MIKPEKPPEYKPEDIRYLGVRPDRVYVFGRKILSEVPELQALCCDHFELEDLLKSKGVLAGHKTDTTAECLYVYFLTREEAGIFLHLLNKLILETCEWN